MGRHVIRISGSILLLLRNTNFPEAGLWKIPGCSSCLMSPGSKLRVDLPALVSFGLPVIRPESAYTIASADSRRAGPFDL